jgi:hypothetical protein
MIKYKVFVFGTQNSPSQETSADKSILHPYDQICNYLNIQPQGISK